MIVLRKAHGAEADELCSLAMRSKEHWGYSEEFMEACKQELLITDDMICSKNSLYRVAEMDGEIVGFYSLNDVRSPHIELGLLFVEPGYIKSGVGRALFEDAKDRAISFGGKILYCQGDPNAEGFYQAMGAKLTGHRESASIPGRYLPTFSINLTGIDVA